jgi:hypothetical protein
MLPGWGLHMPTPFPTTADEDPPEARDVTRKLAHYVVATRFEDLPEGVRREVGRSARPQPTSHASAHCDAVIASALRVIV